MRGDGGGPPAGVRDAEATAAAATATTTGRDGSDRRAVAAILALAAVPWSVQTYAVGGATLLFPWGLVDPAGPHVTTLPDFLFVYTAGLPDYILAWPLGVALWGGALASALAGARWNREDVRVTAGLLVLAGVTQVTLARGFAVQPGRTAYPTGTVALWAVAWWWYWPAIRGRVRAWLGR